MVVWLHRREKLAFDGQDIYLRSMIQEIVKDEPWTIPLSAREEVEAMSFFQMPWFIGHQSRAILWKIIAVIYRKSHRIIQKMIPKPRNISG